MTDRELMQQALEALELHAEQYPHMQKGYTVDAIKALRERLAQPEQEPVAWLYRDSWGTMKLSQIMPPPVGAFPVYTHPQRRQWQPLTYEQIDAIRLSVGYAAGLERFASIARAIEAKLREKNA